VAANRDLRAGSVGADTKGDEMEFTQEKQAQIIELARAAGDLYGPGEELGTRLEYIGDASDPAAVRS
jgi:hypothetical protein